MKGGDLYHHGGENPRDGEMARSPHHPGEENAMEKAQTFVVWRVGKRDLPIATPRQERPLVIGHAIAEPGDFPYSEDEPAKPVLEITVMGDAEAYSGGILKIFRSQNEPEIRISGVATTITSEGARLYDVPADFLASAQSIAERGLETLGIRAATVEGGDDDKRQE
jgi:hypothetical protein